ALGVAMIWAANERLRGQRIPERMMELLPIYEEAMVLRPLPTDTPQQRRAAVAARFLGFAGNVLSQLYKVCQALAGSAFEGFAGIPDPWIYLPGINPGPQGFEWSTGRCYLAVQLLRTGAPDASFLDLIRRMRVELNTLCPAWMTFGIGTDE